MELMVETQMETKDEAHQPLLKITTQGRYSGRAESHLLPFRLHGDQYLVGATNHNSRIKPDWYLNLKEEPIVEIQIADVTFYARAITPTGNERLRATNIIKDMIQFPDRVPRETAAVVLQPLC